MKFFKQTKETKRKISFFMALAMIISLLPVSPVAQAATKDTSNVYVTVDSKSKKYVTVKEVVTSGAVGATTASVIVAPLDKVTFTDVATSDAIKTDIASVKSGEALTLGSISIETGSGANKVTTSASVVIREKENTSTITPDASGVISSSSIQNAVIAEVAIAATGEVITETSKNITGAVISINKIAQNKDIEVAIVMEDGKKTDVTKPKHKVFVTGEGRNFVYEAKYNGELFWSSDSKLDKGFQEIPEGDKINITIKPLVNEAVTYTFEKEGAVKPTVNGKPALGEDDVYTYDYTVSEEDDIIDGKVSDGQTALINAEAVLKDTEPEDKKFAVTINSSNINSNIDLKLSSNDTAATPVTGTAFDVTDGKTVTIEVSPKTGYVWNGENPRPSLTDSANNTAKWTEKEDKTAYEYTFIVTKASEITISGGQVLGVPEEAIDTVKDAINNAVSNVDGDVTDKTGDLELGVTIADDTKAADVLANIMEAMVTATTDSAVAGTIWFTDKNGEAVAKTFEEVMSAFEEKTIEMVTTINISIDNKDYKAEVTSLENGIFGDKAEITLEDSNGTKKVIKKADIKNLIESGVALDITLNTSFVINKGTADEIKTIAVKVKEVGSELEITMNIPKNIDTKGKDGNYFVIRIHGKEITLLPCTKSADGKKISFMSDKFSTYIVSFLPNESGSINDPTSVPDNTNRPLGPGSYVPGGGGAATTSTPVPSATPSASPSASASAAPGTTSSANPADPGTGNGSNGGGNTPVASSTPVPTKTPAGNNDDDKTTGSTSSNVKVGKNVTVNSSKYKVTSVKSGSRAVQFTSGKKNAKTVVVPATVKISGKNYKVTSIAKNAFKGNKKLKKVTIGVNVNKIGKTAFKGCKNLKSIIVKTKKLTAKKTGANAFKGINKKATFKVPKNKVKAYKKIVKAKGAAKTVKVKK